MLSNARVQRSTEERGGGPFKIRAEVYNIPKKNLFCGGVSFFFVGARLTVAPLPLFRTGVAEEGGFFLLRAHFAGKDEDVPLKPVDSLTPIFPHSLTPKRFTVLRAVSGFGAQKKFPKFKTHGTYPKERGKDNSFF